MRRLLKNTSGRTAKRILPAAAIGLGLLMASLPNAAHAQFFDGWGGGGWGGWGDAMGPGQIYNSITDRGFRVIGPLRRNGSVFVADVVDRRGRRERLIVAAADGEILQRFLLQDPGFGTAPRNDLAQPRQEFGQPVERADRGDLVPPASIPNVGGGGGETAVEPPRQRAVPRPVKPPRPRVVDRTPDETLRRDVVPSHPAPRLKFKVPAEATAKRPSEPATTTASRPADTPEKPSVPAPTPTPAAPTTTTKLSDPLAIPGGEPKPAKPPAEAPTTSAAATGTPSNPRIIPGTVTGAPAPAAPPAAAPATPAPAKSTDVPVAPLD